MGQHCPCANEKKPSNTTYHFSNTITDCDTNIKAKSGKVNNKDFKCDIDYFQNNLVQVLRIQRYYFVRLFHRSIKPLLRDLTSQIYEEYFNKFATQTLN